MSVATASNPTLIYRSNYSSNNINNNVASSLTQQVQLPKIVHSGTRVGDPTTLNVTARGVSRASSLGDMVDKIHEDTITGRPLPSEFDEESTYLFNNNNKLKKSKSISHSFTHKSLSNGFKNDSSSYSIPDNVKTVYSPDISKPSMPVFGKNYFSIISSSN